MMRTTLNFRLLLTMVIFFLIFNTSSGYAAPTPGFPTINNTTIVFTEEEDRDDYSILVPSTTTDGWFRETYLFLDLDTYSIRVQRYRNAFVATIMQPELTQRLKESGYGYALLRDLAAETSDIAEAGSELSNLASILKSGQGIFELNPSSIQTTLQNWQEVVGNKHISQSLSDMSDALSGVGLLLQITGNVADDIFLHAIANGLVLERLECLEEFMNYNYMTDPAAAEGFILAKQDVQYFLEADVGVIQSVLNSFQSHGTGYLVTLSSFIPAMAQHFGLISDSLAASIKRVLLPYYLSYNILVDMFADYEDIQSMCAAATLNSALLHWSWDQIDSLPDSSEPTFENARRCLLTTVQIRYGIGYWYNKKYDDILDLNSTSLLDWIQGLTQLITGQYSSVQDFRADVLQVYMDWNYNYTIEINPYLGYNLQPDISPPDSMLSNGSVSPVAGDVDDTYTFLVDYLNQGGNAPTSAKVCIDDTCYNMTSISGTPSNGTYRYQISSLSSGNHEYYFKFNVINLRASKVV